MSRFRNVVFLSAIVIVGLVLWRITAGGSSNIVGRAPLSLDSAGTWVNATSSLDWNSLGGKVVWLEFSFLH